MAGLTSCRMIEIDKLPWPASESPHRADIVWIPGGTPCMGSDKHYAEEAPVHRVTVDGFWIDRTPVTKSPIPRIRQGDRPHHLRRDRAGPQGISWCSAEYAQGGLTGLAAHTCVRRITAGVTARPHAMRTRWTPRRATSAGAKRRPGRTADGGQNFDGADGLWSMWVSAAFSAKSQCRDNPSTAEERNKR